MSTPAFLNLSAHAADVKEAVDSGIAAGRILPGSLPADPAQGIGQIRIAFDGDAVLFSPQRLSADARQSGVLLQLVLEILRSEARAQRG